MPAASASFPVARCLIACWRAIGALPLILFTVPSAMAGQETGAPDQVITGMVTGDDAQTYRDLPFDVPAGVERITVTLDYDRSTHTVLYLGVWDPSGFRGWSGSVRDRFTIAAGDATPGYLPGSLPAGRWKVVLAVPNARPGSRADYRVKVYFDRGESMKASAAIASAPIREGPGWYRGDLHLHTGESDGSCRSNAGVKVPCPLFRMVERASAAGLDFVSLTEHNTVAHDDALREMQPWFDRMLLIPGVEMTTFHGHANIFGPTRFVDFRVGSAAVPDIRAMERGVAAAGAILSINHPMAPSGETCMGCGWTWPDTDWAGVTAIETVNGSTGDNPLDGMKFWYARLNEGHRLTGIGGSDTHDPDGPSVVGRPTTVVHAEALSQPAILAGIKRGEVFIDVEGTHDRLIEMRAVSDGRSAVMGGTLRPGRRLSVELHLVGVAGAGVELIANGQPIRSGIAVDGGDARLTLTVGRRQACGWIAANVRSGGGRMLLVGNPIYVDCRQP